MSLSTTASIAEDLQEQEPEFAGSVDDSAIQASSAASSASALSLKHLQDALSPVGFDQLLRMQ